MEGLKNRFLVHRIALLAIFFLIAICTYVFFSLLWSLIALGILLFLLLLIEISHDLRWNIPFGHLTLLNYVLQFILFSTILYFYPANNSYEISPDRFEGYLLTVIPACYLLYLGYSLAVYITRKISRPILKKPSSNWANYAIAICLVGIFFWLIPYKDFFPQSLSFVFVLLANLRYVGLFLLLLQTRKKWLPFALLIFFLEFIIAADTTMFHSLIIWSISFMLIFFYKYQLRAWAVIIIFASLFILIILQSAKTDYRQSSSRFDVSSPLDSIVSFSSSIATGYNSIVYDFDVQSMSSNFARFNQGWIIDRLMQRVPLYEPYAKGETIYDGLYASIAPRFLDSNKKTAGGQALFERFVGRPTSYNTSMNISMLGEFYVNFGKWGVYLGLLFFGVILGFVLTKLAQISSDNPAWWAWVPYVGFYAFKAEAGFTEVLNWAIKSIVVMIIVVWIGNHVSIPKTHFNKTR